MLRTRANLIALAQNYARERRAPMPVMLKEILHYEILYALIESGAAAKVVFQGGACLRLCHQGGRYSEDLDFAGGAAFDSAGFSRLGEILGKQIADAYGLKLELKVTRPGDDESRAVNVVCYQARIHLPREPRSLPQKQVIKLEIASVPARDYQPTAVAANYMHLPAPHRGMMLLAESPREILADKVIALAARPYLKARDIWDIKFLVDRGVTVAHDLVTLKVADSGLARANVGKRLRAVARQLATPEAAAAFIKEMTRFLDPGPLSMLEAAPDATARYLKTAATVATQAAAQIASG